MKTSLFLASLKLAAGLTFAAALASTPLRAQPVIYGLTATNSLVILRGDALAAVTGPNLSGLGAGETVVAIDFRPFNGALYALTRDAGNIGRLYTANLSSGALTPVTLAGPALTISGSVGMDFNPAALVGTNALRIITGDEQNYRLVFSAAGATVNVDGALNVAGGASGTNVIATAYSNNRAGLPGGAGAGGTVQYALDSDTDQLYRVNPPNNGTLTNGLPLGLNADAVGGLDIVTGTDRAIALLTVGGALGFYEINLATGAATLASPLSLFLTALVGDVVDLAAPIPPEVTTPLVYGLTTTNSLVRFSADGGPVVFGPEFSGLGAGETVVGIDFRPLTGELYAVSRDGANVGRLYTVNVASGALTSVTLSGPTLTITGSVGIDFNPAAAAGVNALRIVTSDEQNYRLTFSGATATVNVDTALNVFGGASGTNVIATAYSNNRSGLPGAAGVGGTTQYAIDSATDRLYRVNPPNGGVLTNGLSLGVAIDGTGGLDIVTGTDRALAIFTLGASSFLYEVNLTTGGAIPVRFLPDGIADLAVPMPVVFPSTTIVGLTATNSLVLFSTDGGPVASGPIISGLGAGETVMAIDFRPFTGDLYALTRDAGNVGRLYTVNPASGVATSVALSGAALTITGTVGMDFNPAAVTGTNALRIVTGDEQNYRLVFSAAGATVNVDSALNVAGASATNVTATAYSNNRSGLPGGAGVGGTIQYAIDSDLDVLYRVNPPNNGTLTEAKPLALDVRSVGGLDLATANDRALAVFDVAGAVGLYEVALTNGATSLIRSLPANITDLAIPTPVLGRLHAAGNNLTVSGGIGPFGVLRADVVTELFCGIAAVTQRSIPIVNEGPAGFYRLADLAATPPVRLTVSLSGDAERPTPVATTADGFGTLEISGNTVTLNIGYRGLSGAAVAAHIHGPANSSGATGVIIDLAPFNGGAFGVSGTLIGSVAISADIKAALLSGLTYVNIHTVANGGGEIRGQVATAVFQAELSGAAERPSDTPSRANGFALFTLIGKELAFDISYRGLSGAAVAAHIHGPSPSAGTAGVLINLAPFSFGPLGVFGRFTGTVTLTPAQLAAVSDGQTYVNIHTALFGGGEVRGQVRPVIASLPLSAALTGAAERPTPVVTSGSGFASVQLAGDTLTFKISYRDLSGPAVAAHFHAPAPASGTAGVQFDLAPFHRGPLATEGLFVGSITLAPEQKTALLNGDFYINLHTAANAGGEIRGQVAPVVMQAVLNGANERPTPVVTPATGYGYLAALGKQLSLGLRYGGLSGAATAAHIHGPATADGAAGVLIDIAPFATGGLAASGFFQGTLTLSDADTASVVDTLTYVNIHTAANGGGEIRGQVRP